MARTLKPQDIKQDQVLSAEEAKKEYKDTSLDFLPEEGSVACAIPLKNYTSGRCLLFIGGICEGIFRNVFSAEQSAFRDFGVKEFRLYPPLKTFKIK